MTDFPLIRGRAFRVTKLDGCGNPVLSPSSVVTSAGFISIALTPNTDEGTAVAVTNANGDLCVSDTPAPKLIDYGVAINLCGVNPELVNLLTGQPTVLDSAAAAVGFRVNTKVNLDNSGFALEVWSAVPSSVCAPGVSASYGYFLLPFLKGGVLSDLTIENGPVNFNVTGARSKDGSGWGVGPFSPINGVGGVAGPLLTAITAGDHLHLQQTTIAPPSTSDTAAKALGVPATGATSAGLYTPTNSYGPLNLAGLTGVTASPNTAWTGTQNVLLRDGTRARWNGTAWVAYTP